MSHPTPQDPERGNEQDINRDYSHSTPNQPPQVESNFGDSSEPLFSMYTKTAEEEDNKMVERWQRDADGILIFTGLFSASVAALLSVTIGDLKPNSQDTSNFHLGNIYGVLADPNATRVSTLSPVAKPPPFSTPRYAVWVNSLWFLSLVMSVSCALWATSLNKWARRYIRLTQPARCSPEKRARLRAFYANGVDKMRIPWAVEGLPMLLHLSLFLFFGGLAVYLFNVDRDIFTCVISWIGLFSMVYGLITLLPLIRQDSPYNTPLSTPIWSLFANISFAIGMAFLFTLTISFFVYAFIFTCCFFFLDSAKARVMWNNLNKVRRSLQWANFDRRKWILKVQRKAEEMAEKQSSEIDGRILGWTISALDDDDSLEKFFEAMPGFFHSEKVKDLREHLPYDLLRDALAGFLGRTLSSNSVTTLVKFRRLNIFMSTINLIGGDCISVSSTLQTFLFKRWDLAPQTIDVADILARWCTSNDQRTALYARCTVTRVLATVPERDNRWIEFVARISGLPGGDIRDISQTGDNLLLSTLIELCRQADHSHEWRLVRAFAQFDIRGTLPRLQHDFCTLWNEFVDKAKIRGDPHSTPVHILNLIRPLYLALHEGTAAAPTEFSAANSFEFITSQPSSYPQCNIVGHRHHPDSTGHPRVVNSRAFPLSQSPHSLPHLSTSDGVILPRQDKQESITTRPRSLSEPTTPKDLAESSREAPTTISAALPTHPSPHPTPESLPSSVAALQGIPPAATLSHTQEETTRQDIVAGAASASNPFLPQPVSLDVGFSIPTSPPPRDPLPDAESLAFLSSATYFHPTGNPTLSRLRVCGLVNTGRMGFVNVVLQLLVHSPPFWNLFRELGDLRRAGDPETGGSMTPLVDATVRLFGEFRFKEGQPPTQQQPQTAERKQREDDEVKKEHDVVDSFEPTYMYDAMKEKRQLKRLFDGQQQDAKEVFHLLLDALDEEILTLFASIRGRNSAAVEERELSQIGQTEVGKRGFPAEAAAVESPLMRIFGGKFRSIVRRPNQADTSTIEDWRSLYLDIQHDSVCSIEDALAHISHLQPLQLGPSGSSAASQQMLVEVLPPVLVLHLKRFLYNAEADGIVKISKPIQFASELNIPLEIMTPISGKSAGPAHYKLYGVLYHHGQSAGGGHYTVDVLLQSEDSDVVESWVHVDDEVVSAVQHEDVFEGRDNEQEDDRCAYMLFYCRTAHAQT